MEITEKWLDQLIDKLDGFLDKNNQPATPSMSANLYPFCELFTPIFINQLKIKNRIMLGPLGNVYMADESGRPSQKMINFLTERAKGGAGLITTGIVPIGQGIDPGLTEPGDLSLFPRIDSSRSRYSGWRSLVENIHSFGSRIFIQLSPGAGRVGSPLPIITKFRLPVSASWNPNYYLADVPCRPLWDSEVQRLVNRMGQAAADAKELGIDGVYIHGHEGYLLDQFSNPAFNRRNFGKNTDYQRFALDTVKEIRRITGNDFPVMYRIGISAGFNAIYQNKLKEIKPLRKFQNERTIQQTLTLIENLVLNGVDIVDVDMGVYDNWWLPHPPNSMPSGSFLSISRLVKDYLSSQGILAQNGLPVPVVAVGKLGYPDLAEKALRDGDCDMVMLARPLLADPNWPAKAYAGLVENIRPCIGDQEACLRAFVTGTHVQCAVNPRAGFEDCFSENSAPTEVSKKIGVIGGGPAGIQFALTAASRGHEVHIYEKNAQIGGMLIPGSLPTIKYEVKNYLDFLKKQLSEFERKQVIKLFTKAQPDVDALKASNYDALVICTGGRMTLPDVPGIHQDHVIQAIELLKNPQLLDNRKKVAVIGGGSVGCETAYWLAAEKGCLVVVIELLPYLMQEVVTANRGHLIHLLEKLGVQLLNCAKLKSINTGTIVVEQNISRTVPDAYNTWQPILPENIKNPLPKKVKTQISTTIISADMVVIATGLKADDSFYHDCISVHAASEVHMLGDAFMIGRIHEAVKSGYRLAISI